MYLGLGKGEACTGFLCGKLKERNHWENPGVDERIILKWIFKKDDAGYGLDQAGSGETHVAGTVECGNEPSCFIKCGEFLD
jgi:hypothetical protein